VSDSARTARFRRDEPVTRILLLGPPGGGKGTQGVRLREQLGVRHLATGDLLRAEMAGGSEAGRQAKAFVERGELVPDEHVLALLEPTLLESAESGGYILDGFPRTVAQAEALDELAERHGIPLQVVISLDVPEEELQRRLLERAGQQGRSDDTPEVIAHRLEVFTSETAPLLDFYDGKGILARIDGDQDVDAITREILERVGAATRTT
jgi:adenylate kinase